MIKFIQGQENKNTLSKTPRDSAILMAFLKEKNEERKLEKTPPEWLNDFLSEFIITVKRKDETNSSLEVSEDFFPASTVT